MNKLNMFVTTDYTKNIQLSREVEEDLKNFLLYVSSCNFEILKEFSQKDHEQLNEVYREFELKYSLNTKQSGIRRFACMLLEQIKGD